MSSILFYSPLNSVSLPCLTKQKTKTHHKMIRLYTKCLIKYLIKLIYIYIIKKSIIISKLSSFKNDHRILIPLIVITNTNSGIYKSENPFNFKNPNRILTLTSTTLMNRKKDRYYNLFLSYSRRFK